MLSKADTDIKKVMAAFAKFGIGVAFLSPTPTAIKKSIMDATASVRLFLKESGLHDFSRQLQGTENKIILSAKFIKTNEYIDSKTSLYRPNTKKGDPRIWFSNLKKYAKNNNLLALLTDGETLFVVNVSDQSVFLSLNVDGSLLNQIAVRIANKNNFDSQKLLNEIKEITKGQFIPSQKKGDTSVGHLLETLLGIKQNSKKTPDKYGIEIKSGRIGKTRKTLFVQVPDWSISKLKSSTEIINKYGYMKDGVLKLNCTLSTKGPNSQGLLLIVDKREYLLNEKHYSPKGYEDVVSWRFEHLQNILKAKHAETFWVDAISKKIDGIEWFKFTKITHSRAPIIQNFYNLIEMGVITVDHLIKKSNDKKSAQERGPSFKINPKDLKELFPPMVVYDI